MLLTGLAPQQFCFALSVSGEGQRLPEDSTVWTVEWAINGNYNYVAGHPGSFSSVFGRSLPPEPGSARTLRNGGFGYLHYTLSAWESEEAMQAFVRAGAHLTAMKSSRALSTEIRAYTFVADSMPSWQEARRLLSAHGKVLSF